MSDNFQTLAFDTVRAAEIQKVARIGLDWMIARGFVRADQTDCVYAADNGLGHRPGPNWRQIVYEARDFDDDFLRLAVNGVHAAIGKGVYNAAEYSNDAKGACPACGEVPDPQFDYLPLAEAWFNGAVVSVPCPLCSTTSLLEDWDFQPCLAFAEGALKFWNWPLLSEEFKKDLLRILSLSRLRHLVGHL